MKIAYIFIVLSLFNLDVIGQQLVNGKTYALIIGVSEYYHPKIPDLDFAHKDAQEFKAYLMSEAGGTVPEENITILINEEAVTSKIGEALDNLDNKTFGDDLVYIYFSGHGDTNHSNDGFFLPHDAPKSNSYVNNAISMRSVNAVINNIASQGVKVVVISDACHAGNVAGIENIGNQQIGELGEKLHKNEVRLASCMDNQKSQEGIGWGNGRGVFSFHLINGLKGLADLESDGDGADDGYVTVREINTYLSNIVPSDLSKKGAPKQDPIIAGDPDRVIAIIDDEVLSLATQQNNEGNYQWKFPETAPRAVNPIKTPIQKYFEFLEPRIEEINFDSLTQTQFEDKNIITHIINQFKPITDTIDTLKQYIENVELGMKDIDHMKNFTNFKYELAALIHTHVQKTIILLLDGNENAHKNKIKYYPSMITIALELTNKNRLLYKYLKVKLHYFNGLIARKNMQLHVDKRSEYFEVAKQEQLKAKAVESKAPFIYDELGTLNDMEGNFSEAIRIYSEANKFAPEWAVPQSKMSNLYLSRQEYDKCLEISKNAIKNQSNNLLAHITRARCARATGNYFICENSYKTAITISPNYILPKAELAALYLDIGMYENANKYYTDIKNIEPQIKITNIENSPDDSLSTANTDFFEEVNDMFSGILIEGQETLEQDYADTLYQKVLRGDTISEIDGLELIRYNIMNGHINLAEDIISKLQFVDRTQKFKLDFAKARIFLMKKDFSPAKKEFHRLLAIYSIKEDGKLVFEKELSDVHYALARLYSINSEIGQSKHQLELSFEKGFDHKAVIENDPWLENLRKSALWDEVKVPNE